jgi:uncharacterized protein (TIGR03067 family)
MRRVVPIVVVLSLGFAPAPVYRERPGSRVDDLKAMQGEWVLAYAHRNGAREGVTQEVVWAVRGDRIITTLDGRKGSTSFFELDGRTTPRSIDLRDGREAAGVAPGRYSVDRDTLKISIGAKRPADLSGGGTPTGVWVFHRKKR